MLLVAGLVALFCLAPGAAWAALPESDRAEQWEFYIPLNYVSSETHGADGGTTVALDSDLGIGFGFGYNFSEYFFLAFDLSFISIDFDARVIEEDAMMNQTVTQVRGNLDSSTFQVRGQYNFMARTFTPFVRAGLGSTFIDSNIPDGPPTGSCWWHPFWGQICGAWQPTHDDTVFSYSAGVGLRWELTDTFYTELSANRLWIDVDVGDSPELDATRFQFGWLF
jgi:opacity protein-like surface antigen